MKKNHLYALGLLSSLLASPVLAQSAATQPVTNPAFEEMLAHVYQDNPQLRSERETMRILDEKVSEAVGGFRPTLGLSAEAGEARVSESNAAWSYGQDRNLALVATQPLYNASTIGQWHAANKRVLEGRARLLAIEQRTLLAAITAWLDLAEKQKLVTLSLDNQRLVHSYLDATQQRLNAGDSTQTDLAVAQSRDAEGQTRYAMAESGLDAARAVFTRATGLPPQMAELPPMPGNLPGSLDETLALARKNPELEQANQEVAATDDDIDSAQGARLPQIFLRGMMSDQHAADLGLDRLRSDSITINASFPIYQGGVEFARVREARMAHQKSWYDAQTTSRNVNEQALEAWGRYRTAQTVIDASQTSVGASQRALAGIDEEQKHGTRTLTEVLDAQAQALNSHITEIQARTDLHMEAYRLLAATGRLSAQNLNLPTTIYDPAPHYEDVSTRWFGTDTDQGDRP